MADGIMMELKRVADGIIKVADGIIKVADGMKMRKAMVKMAIKHT